eukprot:3414930-Pyramimonas_sp.AAC.1
MTVEREVPVRWGRPENGRSRCNRTCPTPGCHCRIRNPGHRPRTGKGCACLLGQAAPQESDSRDRRRKGHHAFEDHRHHRRTENFECGASPAPSHAAQ